MLGGYDYVSLFLDFFLLYCLHAHLYTWMILFMFYGSVTQFEIKYYGYFHIALSAKSFFRYLEPFVVLPYEFFPGYMKSGIDILLRILWNLQIVFAVKSNSQY